jgi:hypothetical protein
MVMKKIFFILIALFLFAYPSELFAQITFREPYIKLCCPRDPAQCINAIATPQDDPEFMTEVRDCAELAGCDDGVCLGQQCDDDGDCMSGITCGPDKKCQPTLTPPRETPPAEPEKTDIYELPNFLGTKDPNDVIARVIKAIIGLSGTLALVIFIWGGIQWLISAGDPKKITSGRNAMMYSAGGLILIFTSYIIVNQLLNILL